MTLEQFIRDGMKAGAKEFCLRVNDDDTDHVKVGFKLYPPGAADSIADVRLIGNVAIIISSVPGVTSNAGNDPGNDPELSGNQQPATSDQS